MPFRCTLVVFPRIFIERISTLLDLEKKSRHKITCSPLREYIYQKPLPLVYDGGGQCLVTRCRLVLTQQCSESRKWCSVSWFEILYYDRWCVNNFSDPVSIYRARWLNQQSESADCTFRWCESARWLCTFHWRESTCWFCTFHWRESTCWLCAFSLSQHAESAHSSGHSFTRRWPEKTCFRIRDRAAISE